MPLAGGPATPAVVALARRKTSSETYLRRLVTTLVLTAAAFGISANATAGTLPADLGQRLADGYIRPATAQLLERSNSLQTSLVPWCEAGAPAAGRAKIDENFRLLLDAWARVELLRFGPMIGDNRFERIFFWPDARGAVPRQLGLALKAADPAALAPGALRARSVAVQGLPAVEFLLFGDGADTLSDGSPASRYRCLLAAATTANVRDISAELVDAWSATGDTGRAFTEPKAENSIYRNTQEVAAEAFKALATGIKFLREAKLAPMMGATASEARAQRGTFWRSGSTARYLAANVRGMGDFYAAAQLADSYSSEERSADSGFLTEIASAQSSLQAIADMPLDTALAEPNRRHLTLAKLIADNLGSMVGGVIAPAFGVTLGFNALDGD
ncbi:imelysin family protein [Pigmentiphaga aceris]|uniref:Imelysin family protein n=2 Tax=Pigmentiphaga aceris TaxID=1940612 RepID=A0A5C0B6E1_9BURK|nr:imelysin family protein [Pigmentiphaga aceris]